MESTELYDERRYLEKGSQYLAIFLYKVNCILGTLGLKAEIGEHLPLHIVIKDIKANKTLKEWHANTKLINLGVTSPGGIFEPIKFNTLDGREFELVAANKGRFELHSREGDIKKELAVVFDNDEVTGIDITSENVNDGWDDFIERVVILNRPVIDKVQIQYCRDDNERSIYYKHEDDESYELRLTEGRINRDQIGERDVSGLIIKIRNDGTSVAYSNDERYGNVIPLDKQKAYSYIKQGFALPRNQEMFAYMRKSLNEQYPGAMALIAGKLSEVYGLCSSKEPVDDEFTKLYEGYTSQVVEFDTPINMDEPYIIEEEPMGIIR